LEQKDAVKSSCLFLVVSAVVVVFYFRESGDAATDQTDSVVAIKRITVLVRFGTLSKAARQYQTDSRQSVSGSIFRQLVLISFSGTTISCC